MGWSGANEIFDPVARKMIELGLDDTIKTEVLTVLINQMQMNDWDTEGESLGDFEDDEAIVEAFRRNGVIVHCGAEGEIDGRDVYCERERGPRGHSDSQHENWQGKKWPVAAPPPSCPACGSEVRSEAGLVPGGTGQPVSCTDGWHEED